MSGVSPGLAATGPYPRRELIDFLNDPPRARRAHSVPSGTAEFVPLPPPPTGRHALACTAITEFPRHERWDVPGFTSVTPWVCLYERVRVHGDGGLTTIDGVLVADTLGNCEPGRQWFAERPDGTYIVLSGPPTPLPGTWLSLLGGGHWNYYHWMLDGIGRLAAADAAMLATCDGVLLPAGAVPEAAETIARLGITRGRTVRHLAPGEALDLECCVVPGPMAAFDRPHPRLPRFLAAGLGSPARAGSPRRLYIDRRGTPNRRLENEDALVAALAGHGVVPVALEGATVAAESALFAGAELIVAPHGAGLVNLVFAPPGCQVIELLPDAYVNWCFRRLAAAAGLRYDCVIGHMGPGAPAPAVHARTWTVPIPQVLAAMEAATWR